MSPRLRKGPHPLVRVLELRCEYATEPLGLGVSWPRFSWKIETPVRDWRQQAYELEVTDAGSGTLVWSSGRQSSPQSVLVPYGGPPLGSRDRASWRVRVWDAAGDTSDWSEKSRLEIGLLEPSDWAAAFISPGWDEDSTQTSPSPYLRREFEVGGEVARARLYVTAVGVYEVEINGTRVGDEFLAPGWTSYRNRLLYQTHDVTALVNRLHENIVWSMKGNFVGVPTDCPQRDERLGWTGDIQVFGPTASYLYDVPGILSSWLEDLSAWIGTLGDSRRQDVSRIPRIDRLGRRRSDRSLAALPTLRRSLGARAPVPEHVWLDPVRA